MQGMWGTPLNTPGERDSDFRGVCHVFKTKQQNKVSVLDAF